jgi:hypothetical protein
MSFQPDLLDELARVYARAAVDEFLAMLAREGPEEILPGRETMPGKEVLPQDSECRIAEQSACTPNGRES